MTTSPTRGVNIPRRLATVTLEMSLKPFRDGFDEANVATVCREVFRQWEPLIRHADAVQVMLWTADGSEILEFTGDLDAEMEWGRFIGGANRLETFEYDPERVTLHARRYDYCEHPPRLTFRAYRDVIATIRRVGEACTGKPVAIGATFDPGPEFSISRFKYEWHPEVCLGSSMGASTMVCCYARLDGDRRRYAAFPDGIPDQLPFGTFLGRQARLFIAALGIDYLWLSNGFGFGMETWGVKGAIFDGARFNTGRRHECGDRIREFWQLLRAELPGIRLETRGTNLLTGTDIGGDGVPLREIYRGGYGLQAPPNSPWAPLYNDYGLELAGWMSHIAELPPDNPSILFRFYILDPWWFNFPWLDRYGREAHDIFLPGAISRLDGTGKVAIADRMNLLSVDDALGNTPERVSAEVIPHLLECRRTAPDEAGPLVWVYPFDEHHDHALGAQGAVARPWAGDWLIHSAINEGLPLNTVVSTTGFLAGRARSPEAYRGRILVTPVPYQGDPMDLALPGIVAAGGMVLLYGSTDGASEAMLRLIGVQPAAPLTGTCAIELAVGDDRCARRVPGRVVHRGLLCDGGCGEVADRARVLATLCQGEERRSVATVLRRIEWHGGVVAWVRGTNGCEYRESHLPTPDGHAGSWPAERLLRLALGEFGWSIRMDRSAPEQPGHVATVHRSANGWFFSGLARTTTMPLRLRTPDGAPLLIGLDTRLEDGHAVYHMSRAWRRECRVFVDQAQDGEVTCIDGTHELIGSVRRLWIRGLRDASVTIYPETGRTASVLLDPAPPFVMGLPVEHAAEDGGRRIVCHHVTGELCITW